MKVRLLRASVWDHSGYGFNQWEEVLLCNASSHWQSPYQEWFQTYGAKFMSNTIWLIYNFITVMLYTILCNIGLWYLLSQLFLETVVYIKIIRSDRVHLGFHGNKLLFFHLTLIQWYISCSKCIFYCCFYKFNISVWNWAWVATVLSTNPCVFSYLSLTIRFQAIILTNTVYWTFGLWKKNSVKFETWYNNFHTRKWIWKYCLQNGSQFILASMC